MAVKTPETFLKVPQPSQLVLCLLLDITIRNGTVLRLYHASVSEDTSCHNTQYPLLKEREVRKLLIISSSPHPRVLQTLTNTNNTHLHHLLTTRTLWDL